jgi:aryl-alcohol dehydrogenase-like predicted oxidoreductase
MLPIPGTLRVEHLEENVAAAGFAMDESKLQEIGRAAGAK